MAITIAQAQAHMDAARSYRVASSFDAAITEAEAALAVYGGLAGSSSDASASYAFATTIEAIKQFIAGTVKAKNRYVRGLAGSGIQRTKIKYIRPST